MILQTNCKVNRIKPIAKFSFALYQIDFGKIFIWYKIKAGINKRLIPA